jgi:hypothetical protein
MRKKFGFFFSVLLIINLGLAGVEISVLTLPLDQVKAGMKGKGKTVFRESKIEDFDVEILGVLYNVEPKKSIIIAKLNSDILEKNGVIQGMSGSPIYVEGKLVGAVAYSMGAFSKEAIVGITPIGEMLAISGKELPKSSFSSRLSVRKYLSLEELFELNKDFFHPRSSFTSEDQTISPLLVPLIFNGFSPRVFEATKPFFVKFGFNPIRGGSCGQSLEKISIPDLSLQGGDPVAIQLVEGDMSVGAVGTVTYVDGNRVLAFGHPVYNLGTVDYAMTKAKVITVVPNLSTSFKLAAPDALVGRFYQDRSSGLLGELGKFPQLVPINIKIFDEGGGIRDFKIKVVKDQILTPFLVSVSLMNILSSEERAVGDLSLELDGDVYLDNGMSVHLEDFFSSNFDNSVRDISNLLTAVVYLLTNNEFKDLGIHRVDLSIAAFEELKLCYLEKVWLDKYEASPGERIQIKVYYRTFRGESILQTVEIYAPSLPSDSEFHLVIGDAEAMHQIEMSQYRMEALMPRSLEQLVRILSNLRKNNRIYFKIIASKPGLFLKGEEMPNLPPSMKSMFSSPRAAASYPTELNKSTLSEYQLPLPYVFKGAAIVPIKIKK